MRECFVIARYSFIQLVRSKVLLNTLLIGLILALVSYVSYQISYGARSKVSLDIGLGLNYLSIIGISLFLGVGLLGEEIENRTLYMTLVSPVRRWQFLLGKIWGLSLVLLLNSMILISMILFSYILMGGNITPSIFTAVIFDLLSALIILSLVVLFSLFSNKVLSVLLTVTVVITGSVLHELAVMNFVIRNEILSIFVEGLKWIMPNFNILDIKDLIIYNHSIPSSYTFSTILYSTLYMLFINMISCVVFQRRELN